MRRWIVIACFTGLSMASAYAQTFTLASQNCLHLGQNDPTTNQALKNTTLQAQISRYDVSMLQEVMSQANLSLVTPGSFYYINTPLAGASSYKEKYAFIITNSFYVSDAAGNNTTNTYWNTAMGGFSRPPCAVLLKTGTNWTWLLDYHAVYGKLISTRRTEVGQMGLVYSDFTNTVINGQKYPRVVIGGDWNLGTGDIGFNNLQITIGAGYQNSPTNCTSLSQAGALSMPYDHFIWNNGRINITNPRIIPTQTNTVWWRKNISDHLGICCTVAY